MLPILVKLLDEPGQVGEEAPSVLADLVANNEELQKIAYGLNAVEKLCKFLHNDSLQSKHLQGVLIALSELLSVGRKKEEGSILGSPRPNSYCFGT